LLLNNILTSPQPSPKERELESSVNRYLFKPRELQEISKPEYYKLGFLLNTFAA
jgi:hypothetical protein